jgi:hypothetical protein
MRRQDRAVANKPAPHRLALALVALLALATSPGCWSPCENELVSTTPSPDGRVKAVVFVRSCGATTPVVTELSVLPADASVPPRGWPNALTLSDDPDHPIQRTLEAIDVQLKWTATRRLSVSFPRAAVADKRATSVSGVGIQYSTF